MASTGAESGTDPYQARTPRMRSGHPKGRSEPASGAPALARVDGDDARRRLKVRIGAVRVFIAQRHSVCIETLSASYLSKLADNDAKTWFAPYPMNSASDRSGFEYKRRNYREWGLFGLSVHALDIRSSWMGGVLNSNRRRGSPIGFYPWQIVQSGRQRCHPDQIL